MHVDMRAAINEERVNQMIECADRRNRGYVDIEDFMWIMEEIGLINSETLCPSANNSPDHIHESDLDKEVRKAKAFE